MIQLPLKLFMLLRISVWFSGVLWSRVDQTFAVQRSCAENILLWPLFGQIIAIFGCDRYKDAFVVFSLKYSSFALFQNDIWSWSACNYSYFCKQLLATVCALKSDDVLHFLRSKYFHCYFQPQGLAKFQNFDSFNDVDFDGFIWHENISTPHVLHARNKIDKMLLSVSFTFIQA